jgi:uncharacterized protein YbjT (DUF2867 family)
MVAKRVLVTGATGQQGGAVVDALTSGEYGEFAVYGMTRNAEGEAAAALADRGVHVVEADMDDRSSLDDAVAGMESVFLVTTFFEAGPEAEAEQGMRVIDACADAGVDHVVYSSVASADTAPLDHFASKRRVEEHLADSGLAWTVVRPVYFMQNFDWLEQDVREGTLAMPLAEGVSLGVVDIADIGRTVGVVLADPDSWVGETIDVAGDELTLAGFAAAFTAALDREVGAIHVDVEAYRAEAGDEMADMYRWFNEGGYDVDVPELSAWTGIDYTTFADYLDAHWASRPASPAA